MRIAKIFSAAFLYCYHMRIANIFSTL